MGKPAISIFAYGNLLGRAYLALRFNFTQLQLLPVADRFSTLRS